MSERTPESWSDHDPADFAPPTTKTERIAALLAADPEAFDWITNEGHRIGYDAGLDALASWPISSSVEMKAAGARVVALHNEVCACDGEDPDCDWRASLPNVLAVLVDRRAVALDVQRLVDAAHGLLDWEQAEWVAAEYARLAESQP